MVIPNVPTPPQPGGNHAVFVVSQNGTFNPGSGMQVNVSGDTNVGVAVAGRGPVFATMVPPLPDHVAIANELEDTVTIYAPASTSGATGSTNTVTLPPGSAPVFLTSTQPSEVYSANSGNDTVSVIGLLTNQVTQTVNLTAGSKPVAVVQTSNTNKVYAINQGNNSVVSINTVDNTVNAPITGAAISTPVWAVARADSQRLYVLSQGNGDIAVIDANTDTLLTGTASVGAGANFMLYDNSRNRLYVTNPVAGTLTILNAGVDPPAVLSSISMNSGSNAPCAGGCSPVSVAALPDGTRAYVASLQTSSSTSSGFVTVIDALNNGIKKNIPLSAVSAQSNCTSVPFRISTAASADSTRVYVARCDAEGVSIVRTSDDTLLFDLPAPVSSFPPPAGSTQPPPQNPVWVVAGP